LIHEVTSPQAFDGLLLNGLDAIGRTLQHKSDIAAFEKRSPSPVATTSL